ncbi:MAG: class II aldolase/adducin family protein [Candidatus Krumholzibacteriota bacterium]|nr:class II aldolase/adducin family protein [Candidatus Krumholzibacteriota bacterium]
MSGKGYTKYRFRWINREPVAFEQFQEINYWRDRLYKQGLIGALDPRTGYGNISVRTEKGQFIITGTATGVLETLSPRHYVRVTDYDLERNTVVFAGPLKASAEALTHAAIYSCDEAVRAVIHAHHRPTWQDRLHRLPTTPPGAEYGSRELVQEILRLFRETDVRDHRFIVLGGHEEGLLSFGEDLDRAGNALLEQIVPDPEKESH